MLVVVDCRWLVEVAVEGYRDGIHLTSFLFFVQWIIGDWAFTKFSRQLPTL